MNFRSCQGAPRATALLLRFLILLITGIGSWATVASSADRNFLAAEKLYRAKEFTQAEQLYSEVNSESSDFPVAQLRLGTIYYLTERPAQAEKCVLAYLKFKESPEVICLLAGAQFNLRKFDLATKSAERALELDPKSSKAYTVLGMIRTAENDFTAAQAHYREALKLNANDSDTWFMLGRALFLRDDFAEAAKTFERSLKINPQVRTYDNLALTKDIQGDLKGAEECYKEGLRAGQTQKLFDSHIYVGYGEFLLKLNRLAESESVVKEGLRAAPQNAALHYELSKVHLRMDRFQEAAQEGETAISLGGPDTKVDYLLAQIYTAMGKPEEASKHASRAAQETTRRER